MSTLNVTVQKNNRLYFAQVEKIPDVSGVGRSQLEAMINLRKSLKKYIADCNLTVGLPEELQGAYRLVVKNE